MSFIPDVPPRFPHRYTKLRCTECNDMRFWRLRSAMDFYGPLEYQCPACHGRNIVREFVTDWYVMRHDPFRKRRIVVTEPDETYRGPGIMKIKD